jgi:hypothetical protein
METDADWLDLITAGGHGMPFMIEALKKELDRQKPITVIAKKI